MDLGLKGKVVFISGSTAGIGFGVAQKFLQEGAHVIVNGRSASSVEKAIERLKSDISPTDNEVKVEGLVADFSNRLSIETLIQELPDVDILINNVGTYSSQSFFETTEEDWQRQYEVNVMSGVRLSKHVLPKMLNKNWGRVIFVSSECATLVPADLIAYSTTKAAILAVSRGLAQLSKGSGVTVNTVMPGSTMTEGADQFLSDLADKEGKSKAEAESDFFKDVRTSSLLQRFATVEEIAHSIVYLSSPLASATNGAAIKLDGGSMGGIL